jgi:hypothetical protein
MADTDVEMFKADLIDLIKMTDKKSEGEIERRIVEKLSLVSIDNATTIVASVGQKVYMKLFEFFQSSVLD